jgi:hypothetical protein
MVRRRAPGERGGGDGDGGDGGGGGDGGDGGSERGTPTIPRDRLREAEPDVAEDDGRDGGSGGVITPTERRPRSEFDVPDRRRGPPQGDGGGGGVISPTETVPADEFDVPDRRAAQASAGGSLVDRPMGSVSGSLPEDDGPDLDGDSGGESGSDRPDALEDVPASLGATNPVVPDEDTGTGLGSDAIDAAAGVEQAAADRLPGTNVATAAMNVGLSADAAVYEGGKDLVSPATSPAVEASREARLWTMENVVDPAAGGFEQLAEPARAVPYAGDELAGIARWQAGGVRAVGGVAASVVPGGFATAAETVGATERAAAFTGEQIGERGVVRGTETIGGAAVGAGAKAASEAGEQFAESPYQTTGKGLGLVGATVLGGAAGGRALGRAARGGRSRARTVGAESIDPEDMTKREVLDRVERGESAFPGADDPALYRSRPAEAVRQQADETTPAPIETALDEATAAPDDAADLVKAVDTAPEGPGPAGFRTLKGEYESPGGFVGPELSPYFLGADAGGARFSLRPGLPDLGDQPTAVYARTRVREPDADTLDGFKTEMLEREGETTARTKPASEVNTGEIEAVVPPQAEFVDVGTGPLRNALRRAGIGSDFATEVGGRRVPIRTVADPDLVDESGSPGLRALLDDDRAQTGAPANGGSRVRRSFSRRDLEEPVDRPLPGAATPADLDRDPDRDSESSRRDRDLYDEYSLAPSRSSSGGSSGGRSPVSSGSTPGYAFRGPASTGSYSGGSAGSGSGSSFGGSSGSSTATSTGSSSGGGGGGGGGSGGGGGGFGLAVPGGRTPRVPDRDGEADDVLPLFNDVETGESWETPIAQADEVAAELDEIEDGLGAGRK